MNTSGLKDDSKIIEACIEGDIASWESLVAKYSLLIYTAISNRIRSYGMSLPSQDVEDIFQNVLTSIWAGQKLAEVKNRVDISYWLAIVSGNMAVEYLRTLKAAGMDKMVHLQDTPDEEAEMHGIEPAEGGIRQDPEENEIPEKIKNALACLRKKEKLIMKLLIFHDKKYGEIARILNMPKGTVASCIKRSRVKLKYILKYILK